MSKRRKKTRGRPVKAESPRVQRLPQFDAPPGLKATARKVGAAVFMAEEVEVSSMAAWNEEINSMRPMVQLELTARVNKTQERVTMTFLLDAASTTQIGEQIVAAGERAHVDVDWHTRDEEEKVAFLCEDGKVHTFRTAAGSEPGTRSVLSVPVCGKRDAGQPVPDQPEFSDQSAAETAAMACLQCFGMEPIG